MCADASPQELALPLPPAELRWGGPRYTDDEWYLRSADVAAEVLVSRCGLSPDSRLLDIGCGQGRALIGVLRRLGRIAEYAGVDVHGPSIDWAREQLAPAVPGTAARFVLIDVANERYRPDGAALRTDGRTLPVPDAGAGHPGFDVVNAYSVFSHMRLADIAVYLAEIARVLASGGRVFVTAFVELGVPDEEENPAGYVRDWSGPLHCVRLNRHRFERLAHDAGLDVRGFAHAHTTDGQSSYVLESAAQ